MPNSRASGILLHPTSLPGQYGCGDMGADAYRFVEWLVASGQSLWQMLPVNPVGEGNSPYSGSSVFAGSPLLIDLVDLGARGWLSADDLRPDPGFSEQRVDFERQIAFRIPRLRRAAQHFFTVASNTERAEFDAFCNVAAAWLDDYALFMTLDALHPRRRWCGWPSALMRREPVALAEFARAHSDSVRFWKFCQWQFECQWAKLKAFANQRGVRIVGDVPIFVSYHSADAWANQGLLELDTDGQQTFVAGVPPDYFSTTGQRWGNPLYCWSAHAKDDFKWWVARVRRALELADIVRIDHFRGFAAYWEIPANEDNAINGRWVPAPGKALFEALHKAFPGLPIIAEDLGVVTPDVEALRDDFGLPGMRILQFAFGEDASHSYLPHNYCTNTVAYPGTHDNDTVIGWWQSASPRERGFAQYYLGTDGNGIQWSLMRALSASVAQRVIYPMQDVLELDGRARMNVPGTATGNWEWRFAWSQVQPWHAAVLCEMAAAHGRAAFSGLRMPD